MSRRSSILLLLLWLLASVYVALAVRAGVSNYSPVPFGDMWPGELLFFIAGSSGDHALILLDNSPGCQSMTYLLFGLL